MADKQIGALDLAQSVSDDASLVAEIQGAAVRITGAQLKALVRAGVEVYVTQAENAARDAQSAAQEAQESAQGVGAAAEDARASASAAQMAQTGAEKARAAVENMSVEGESVAQDQPVTVSKMVAEDGTVTLKFYIPQGRTGPKGDTGDTGEIGPVGPQGVGIASVTVSPAGELTVTLTDGTELDCGSVLGPPGPKGDPGSSIRSIDRTEGTGAAGTSDTYTVTLTDGTEAGTFQVYNGRDGSGAGDMTAAVYDPQGKKTDVYKYIDDKIAGLTRALKGVFLVRPAESEVT